MEQHLSRKFFEFESVEPPPSVYLKNEEKKRQPRKEVVVTPTQTETLDEVRKRLAEYGRQNPEEKPFVDPCTKITVHRDSKRPPISRGINRKRKNK